MAWSHGMTWTYEGLAARLWDAQRELTGHRPRPTFPSCLPFLRIDHVFVSRSIEVLGVDTLRTPAARIASDHLPLVIDFRVPGPLRGRVATSAA